MRIENVSRDVHLIFMLMGFDEFIPITLADAAAPQFSADVSFKKFLRKKNLFSGDNVAFTCAGDEYTWRDVETCSKGIANDFFRNGVRQGSNVAICGANSVNWLLTFFAAQKLGAVAVLVDCELPAEKIAALIRAADVEYFCLGELPTSTDEKIFRYELQKYSVGKIRAFHTIRDDVNFKARPVGKSKFHADVHVDDPCVMMFDSGGGKLFSSRDILRAALSRSIADNGIYAPFSRLDGLTEIFADMLTDSPARKFTVRR